MNTKRVSQIQKNLDPEMDSDFYQQEDKDNVIVLPYAKEKQKESTKAKHKKLRSLENLVNSDSFILEYASKEEKKKSAVNGVTTEEVHTKDSHKNSDPLSNANYDYEISEDGEVVKIRPHNDDTTGEDLEETIRQFSKMDKVKQVIFEKQKKEEITQVNFKLHHSAVEPVDRNGRLQKDLEHDNRSTPQSKPLLNHEKQNSSNAKPDGKLHFSNIPSEQLDESHREEHVHHSKEKMVFTKKEQGIKNRYFYKIKSHSELYKIGMSYLGDFNNGYKSHGIMGHQCRQEIQSNILAIASFIKYQIDIKVLIVSLNLKNGLFSNVLATDHKVMSKDSEKVTPNFYEHENITFTDLQELFILSMKSKEIDYEDSVNQFLQDYDFILWEIPEMTDLTGQKEKFFPIIMNLDKVSMVVKEEIETFNSINSIVTFFTQYGVSIKGALMAAKSKHLPLWKRKASSTLPAIVPKGWKE